MANWSLPTLSSTYTNRTSEIKDRDLDVAKGMDPANVTVTNPVTNMIRWNSANSAWEKYNGATWDPLDTEYDINISGTAGAVDYTDITSLPTTLAGYGITDGQPLDADLTAVAGLGSTGLIARTGAGTMAVRTITAPASGISLTNGDGVSGNPTLALTNDLAAVEGLGTTGLVRRTAANTWSAGTTVATAEITDDAVTYAKIQDVTATDRLLGRSTAGSGVIEEITCTAAGRQLLDDATAAAMLVTLGINPLAIASGGTGATTAATAFTALKQAASDTATGVLEIATAAEMETGTDVVRAVTPGRVQYHDGVAKAWAYITNSGTPTATASYNVSSITDPGVGNSRVNFATDMSAATAYSEFGTIDNVGAGNVIYYHFTSTTARSVGAGRNFLTEGAGPAAADLDCCQLFFGDQ
jgi:hypothetical protein